MNKKEAIRLAKAFNKRVDCTRQHKTRAAYSIKYMSISAMCQSVGISRHIFYYANIPSRNQRAFPAWHKMVVDTVYRYLVQMRSDLRKLVQDREKIEAVAKSLEHDE